VTLTPQIIIDTEVKYRNIERVWKLGHFGEGVTIPLIDTGVDASVLPIGSVQDQIDLTPDTDGRDHYGHGTLMARFILGMAPKAKIISVKVFSKSKPTSREDLVSALYFCYALQPRPKYINCSLAVRRSSLFGLRTTCTEKSPCVLCKRVNSLWNEGVVVVAAAGNFSSRPGSIACPANARSALKVRSLENSEDFSWTQLAKQLVPSADKDSRNELLGTSQAAAFVSADLALISSAFPNKPAPGLSAVLFYSGVSLETLGREVYPKIFKVGMPRTSLPNVYRTYVIMKQDETAPGSWNGDKSLAHTRILFECFRSNCSLDKQLQEMTLALKYDESNYLAWLGASILMNSIGNEKEARKFLTTCNELLPPADALSGQQIFGGAP
jgi:hypothetical protein